MVGSGMVGEAFYEGEGLWHVVKVQQEESTKPRWALNGFLVVFVGLCEGGGDEFLQRVP